MDDVLTLISDPDDFALEPRIVAEVREALKALGAETSPIHWLSEEEACDMLFSGLAPEQAEAAALAALKEAPVDVVAQGVDGRRKKLLIADMDSTIVTCETLDELADFAGLKAEIAELTERAMAGEIGFADALKVRVGMLKGLGVEALEQTLERVELTPGAKTLVATMKAHGAYTCLISGGFDFFTDRVRADVGFDCSGGNKLIVKDGKLTGQVAEPILNKDAKLARLIEIAGKREVAMSNTLAIGDGANDAPMLRAAGLGVAYHGHEAARDAAQARLDHTNLTGALFAQGYAKEEFANI